MLVRRGVATVAFAGLLSAPSLARAQAFDVKPSGTVSAGYAASELIPIDPTLNPQVLSRPFISLGPALALTYETPRSLHSLQTSFILSLPITSNFTFADVPPTYTARAAYTNKISLSELWLLTSGLAFSVIPTNPLVAAVDAYDTVLDTTPADVFYNLSLSANEALTREISESTRVVQAVNVSYNYPYNIAIVRPSTFTAKGSVALTHNFPLDALTVTLNVGYTRFGVGESLSGGVNSSSSEFINTLIGTWQRPLTDALTSSVDLGLLQAVSPDGAGGQIWQPTGGARLAYTREYATASLSYTHGALVNVFTSTVDLHDQVALRAGLPIGATGLALASTIGFTYTAPIATDGTLGSPYAIYLADVGVTYVPPPLPQLSASVRATYDRQIPVNTPLLGFTRLALNVNVAFSFPDARAAASQRRIAPAYVPTPSLGSDSTPAPGVQPTPIEVINAPPEGGEAAPPAPAKP